jgi:hypothetical protein
VASPSAAFSEQSVLRLESELVRNGKLVVVDRANLDKIRAEQGFQLSGEVDDDSAQSIGKLLGAGAIVTGSIADLGDVYSLSLKAITVETAMVAVSYLGELSKTQRIKTLIASGGGATPISPAKTPATPNQSVSSGTDDEWKNKWLYMGARAGFSIGSYANGGGLADKSVYLSQTIKSIPVFDAALSVSVPVWSLFAVQTEAVLFNDTFELYSGKTSLMKVSYYSLLIPLMAKAVYRPSIFMIQAYAGGYLSLPLGQMEVKHRNGSYTVDFPVMPGFIAGGGFGMKLGPGVVAADIRYTADAGNISVKRDGDRDVSQRSKLSFALGYEIGLIQK